MNGLTAFSPCCAAFSYVMGMLVELEKKGYRAVMVDEMWCVALLYAHYARPCLQHAAEVWWRGGKVVGRKMGRVRIGRKPPPQLCKKPCKAMTHNISNYNTYNLLISPLAMSLGAHSNIVFQSLW